MNEKRIFHQFRLLTFVKVMGDSILLNTENKKKKKRRRGIEIGKKERRKRRSRENGL